MYVWWQLACASLYVEGGKEMRRVLVGGGFSRVGNFLAEGYDVSVFWDEVELIFGVVSSGWYWEGGHGWGVFMIVFRQMACVF